MPPQLQVLFAPLPSPCTPFDPATAVHLAHLFACPETNALFPTHASTTTVTSTPAPRPVAFHCPLCHARLSLSPPGTLPVAACAPPCTWSTPASITSFPELLARESSPFPRAARAFTGLVRAAAASARKPPPPAQCATIADFAQRKAEEEESRRGFHRLGGRGGDAQLDRWRGEVCVSDFIAACDRVEAGTWAKSDMPARRRPATVVHRLLSPFTGKTVAKAASGDSLTDAPANAEQFLPQVRGARVEDTIVLEVGGGKVKCQDFEVEVVDAHGGGRVKRRSGKEGNGDSAGGEKQFLLEIRDGDVRLVVLRAVACVAAPKSEDEDCVIPERKWEYYIIIHLPREPVKLFNMQ